MLPGTYNIVCRQGSTLSLTFELKNPDGSAVDLTGCLPRMQVRASASAEAVALDCTSRLSVTDAAAGKLQLVVAAADMAAVPAGTYVYDLDVVMADSSVDTWLTGTFTVLAEVTR